VTNESPPFILRVVGEVKSDGKAVGLSIERVEQGPVDLCLRIEDVQDLVNLLLALGCEAVKRQASREVVVQPTAGIPLPVSAIDICQGDDARIFLMFEVGVASLMFGLRQSDLKEIGQTLLTLSAPSSGAPS